MPTVKGEVIVLQYTKVGDESGMKWTVKETKVRVLLIFGHARHQSRNTGTRLRRGFVISGAFLSLLFACR